MPNQNMAKWDSKGFSEESFKETLSNWQKSNIKPSSIKMAFSAKGELAVDTILRMVRLVDGDEGEFHLQMTATLPDGQQMTLGGFIGTQMAMAIPPTQGEEV